MSLFEKYNFLNYYYKYKLEGKQSQLSMNRYKLNQPISDRKIEVQKNRSKSHQSRLSHQNKVRSYKNIQQFLSKQQIGIRAAIQKRFNKSKIKNFNYQSCFYKFNTDSDDDSSQNQQYQLLKQAKFVSLNQYHNVKLIKNQILIKKKHKFRLNFKQKEYQQYDERRIEQHVKRDNDNQNKNTYNQHKTINQKTLNFSSLQAHKQYQIQQVRNSSAKWRVDEINIKFKVQKNKKHRQSSKIQQNHIAEEPYSYRFTNQKPTMKFKANSAQKQLDRDKFNLPRFKLNKATSQQTNNNILAQSCNKQIKAQQGSNSYLNFEINIKKGNNQLKDQHIRNPPGFSGYPIYSGPMMSQINRQHFQTKNSNFNPKKQNKKYRYLKSKNQDKNQC